MDLLCYWILKGIKSLGTELRAINWWFVSRPCSQAGFQQNLKLHLWSSKGAAATANTNPGVAGIITTSCYLCRVVSRLPELWAYPYNHTPSAYSENVSRWFWYHELVRDRAVLALKWFCTENCHRKLRYWGMGLLPLGGSQVSVLQLMTLIAHLGRRSKEVDWLLHNL